MALQRSKQTYHAPQNEGIDSDGRNGLVIDKLPRELLGLNHPKMEPTTLFQLHVPFQSHLQCQYIFGREIGTRYLMEKPKKRPFMEMMTTTKEPMHTKLDLTLRLSPPGNSLPDPSPPPAADDEDESNPLETSSPNSQASCISMEMKPSQILVRTNNTDEVPSLVLMGCPHCLIYIMVPEVDIKCPLCSSTVLIDTFRQTKAKRSKKD